MRQIAVFVMIILFLATGCSKTFIQVFDISTTNTERIDKYYVFENDTIKITYSFWASKGVMSFSIFNKTDTPIYIDWKNSSFIYNGEKKNYYIDESHTDMASYYKGVYYNGPRLELGYAVSSGVMTAASSTVKAERITFIPPKSHFSKSSFLLLPVCYYKTSNFKMNIEARSDKPKKKTAVYSENFTFNESPLDFRNYLAFSFVENSPQLYFIDNEFYLSSVKEMDMRHYRGKWTGNDDHGRAMYQKPFKSPTAFYITIDKMNCPSGWDPKAK